MLTNFFTFSALWHEKIGRIYALLERVKLSEEQTGDILHLRKTNRILSINATTSIEGNRLSLSQVRNVINGKPVWGPPRDIKEVQNAFAAYEAILELEPYSVEYFLKAHKLLTNDLIRESGEFRTVGVNVVNGMGQILHTGADYKKVPSLIENLLKWGENSDTHPIIKSSAIHYMIEHIHPFRDGNGRMGRLWQTLILSKWNPVFEWMPVETLIYHNQARYYLALQESHKNKELDCKPFIDFMLEVIENSLYKYIDIATETAEAHYDGARDSGSFYDGVKEGASDGVNDGVNEGVKITERQNKIITLIKKNKKITAMELTERLKISKATTEREIAILKKQGVIERIGADKNGYWRII